MSTDVAVRQIDAREIAALRDQLADVLLDCVEGGASVSFMLPMARATALLFWDEVAGGVARGERTVFVAEDGEGVVGTVQLTTGLPENQPHRADVAKLLVHRRARNSGIGRRLMLALEDAARAQGKTLLVLDTANAAAERLYARLGWQRVGSVPGYALLPNGEPCDTAFFYKPLQEQAMQITFETPDQPAVHALIRELDAHLYSLYPPENVYALDVASLCAPDVLFAVVREPDGTAIGCGAIVIQPEYGEVKRMYLRPQARGRGLARRLLAALEAKAMEHGCRSFMLETGPTLDEALALYERMGYRRRGPFGDYPDHPTSVFMQKDSV